MSFFLPLRYVESVRPLSHKKFSFLVVMADGKFNFTVQKCGEEEEELSLFRLWLVHICGETNAPDVTDLSSLPLFEDQRK